MTKLREASDLSQEERERIVAAWGQIPGDAPYWASVGIIGTCLNITEDTVRQVLREEGE